jgi:4-amino-4-deoxy-L-arabinose transferase-like glycosyltransferase
VPPVVVRDRVRDEEAEASARRRVPGFWPLLVLVVAVALILRVGYVLATQDEPLNLADAALFRASALGNTHGDWFMWLGKPAAQHPPGWTLVLTAAAALRLQSVFEMQMVACVVGTLGVFVTGLAGRRVGGARVGLLAAGISAVYPGMWVFSRELLSETLLFPLVALVVLLAYRFHDRPSLPTAAALGAAVALAALTRAECLLLAAVLVVPLVWRATSEPRSTRVGWLAVAGLICALVIAPWSIFNTARFDAPVLLSTNLGVFLAVGNCPDVYAGARLGYWEQDCAFRVALNHAGDNAAQLDGDLRLAALRYARDHLSRVPVAVIAKEGRTWSFYRPGQQINLDRICCATDARVLWARFVAFWLLVPAAVVGGIALRRRARPVWPLLTFFLVVVLTTAMTTGEPRYRATAEVPLVILAAVGFDALRRRVRSLACPR